MGLAEGHAGAAAGDEACRVISLSVMSKLAGREVEGERTGVDRVEASKEAVVPWLGRGRDGRRDGLWMVQGVLCTLDPVRDVVVLWLGRGLHRRVLRRSGGDAGLVVCHYDSMYVLVDGV